MNWLNHLSTTEAENVFNPIKGSTSAAHGRRPVRLQPDRPDDDGRLQQGYALPSDEPDLKNAEFISGLNEAMRQFALDRNVDAVMDFLKNRYDLL